MTAKILYPIECISDTVPPRQICSKVGQVAFWIFDELSERQRIFAKTMTGISKSKCYVLSLISQRNSYSK